MIEGHPSHIHTPDDGRGVERRVFVNGEEVSHVFYADTKLGFVRYWLQPVRANRRRTNARWAKKRGRITIMQGE